MNTDYIVKSGNKIKNSSGITLIKDGIKPGDDSQVASPKKPAWLKIQARYDSQYLAVKDITRRHRLSTVCEEAKCPNIGECWSAGTATFMLMGAVCTRACRFCAVDTGNPHGLLDTDEPRHVAEAVRLMGLRYTVLTSVNRDDLPDGGAHHYAACVRTIKQSCPDTEVEALTPDFQGNDDAVQVVLDSGIAVFAQNVETVRRLTHPVRDPRASYEQTLRVLAYAKRERPDIIVKTSLMLGLGEHDEEIAATMDDLRDIGTDVLTLGQYLRPTRHHLPVRRYVTPQEFNRYRQIGLKKGFLEVVSGPLVRSSYRAERVLQQNNAGIA